MNRSGLILIGAALAIVGYALVFSGLTTLNPNLSPTGSAMSTLQALIPGQGTKASPGSGSGTSSSPGFFNIGGTGPGGSGKKK